ncbi:MAG: spore coat protein CotJB [Clostridia bacterium]|nr:spore coat protein CotJB [Clostridia bacterium]
MRSGDRQMANAMNHLQALSFAMQEALLYLDGHPDSTAAARYYNKVSTAYEAAKREYEEKYGPLSVGGGTAANTNGRWLWVEGPWPWEVTFPNNGENPGMVEEE